MHFGVCSLSAYAWPGNVRQLEMVVESLVAMEEGDEIDLRHFPSDILAIGHPDSSAAAVTHGVEEHRRILEALSDTEGNRTQAAKILGMSRPTLRSRMEDTESRWDRCGTRLGLPVSHPTHGNPPPFTNP